MSNVFQVVLEARVGDSPQDVAVVTLASKRTLHAAIRECARYRDDYRPKDRGRNAGKQRDNVRARRIKDVLSDLATQHGLDPVFFMVTWLRAKA